MILKGLKKVGDRKFTIVINEGLMRSFILGLLQYPEYTELGVKLEVRKLYITQYLYIKTLLKFTL